MYNMLPTREIAYDFKGKRAGDWATLPSKKKRESQHF